MSRWRWGTTVLVLALGLAVSMKLLRAGYGSSSEDALTEGFGAFAEARHDLV